MDALSAILFQYYNKEIPKTPVFPTQAKANGQTPEMIKAVPVSGIGINISAMGRQVNAFSKTLTGDESAKNGLRSLVMEIGNSKEPSEFAGAVGSLRQLQTADPETFKNVFSAVGDLAQTGAKASPFLKTLGTIENTNDKNAFTSSIKSILASDGSVAEKTQTLQKTVETVKDVTAKTNGKAENSLLSKLFQGMNEAGTLQEKDQFLMDFMQKNDQSILT